MSRLREVGIKSTHRVHRQPSAVLARVTCRRALESFSEPVVLDLYNTLAEDGCAILHDGAEPVVRVSQCFECFGWKVQEDLFDQLDRQAGETRIWC